MKVKDFLVIRTHDSCQSFGSFQLCQWVLVRLPLCITQDLIAICKTVNSTTHPQVVCGLFLATENAMSQKRSDQSHLQRASNSTISHLLSTAICSASMVQCVATERSFKNLRPCFVAQAGTSSKLFGVLSGMNY